MSAHGGEVTEEVAIEANEQNGENISRFSPDKIEERIRANLEQLHAHISVLAKLMARSIQGNAAREIRRASTLELRLQSQSPFTEAPGTFRFPPVVPLTTTGYSPNSDASEIVFLLNYTSLIVVIILVSSFRHVFKLLNLNCHKQDGKKKKKNAQGSGYICASRDSLIVPGKDAAIGCDLCTKWFHSVCVKSF